MRNIVDGWFFTLEEDVLAEGTIDPIDEHKLLARTNELLEQRLAQVSSAAPIAPSRLSVGVPRAMAKISTGMPAGSMLYITAISGAAAISGSPVVHQ